MHIQISLTDEGDVLLSLGTDYGTAGNFDLNLTKLVATRLLVQSAFGGGKSFALRRIIEQAYGKVQQIIIDSEAELHTLAEGFDFLVLSPDSEEAPLTLKSASGVARLLHESQRSAVLNLHDFEPEEQQAFVDTFLRALMRLPPTTWRPVCVYVDEAQVFAPQHDVARSKKAMVDSAPAVGLVPLWSASHWHTSFHYGTKYMVMHDRAIAPLDLTQGVR